MKNGSSYRMKHWFRKKKQISKRKHATGFCVVSEIQVSVVIVCAKCDILKRGKWVKCQLFGYSEIKIYDKWSSNRFSIKKMSQWLRKNSF